MGTRRRDAQHRQVSLTVETLEDRFLLSGAASLSMPTPTNGPVVLVASAHNTAVRNEAHPASPRGISGYSLAGQSTSFPLHPLMAYQHDDDGDNDSPDITDSGNSDNADFGYPLLCTTDNHAVGCLDLTLLTRTPEQMALPTVSLISFLPLLSASGLGITNVGSLLPIPSTAVCENLPANHDPAPGKEDLRPLPVTPEASPSTLPPMAEDTPDTPPSSRGRPLAELLPIDVETIQRGAEVFFLQLSELSEEWQEGQLFERLAPWLLVASVAGYGWIRLRDRRDRCLADLLTSDRPETVPPIFLSGGKG